MISCGKAIVWEVELVILPASVPIPRDGEEKTSSAFDAAAQVSEGIVVFQ